MSLLPPNPPPQPASQPTANSQNAVNVTGTLELRIFSHSMSLYPAQPPNITSDALAVIAMTPLPTPLSTSNTAFIRLLSGPLQEFMKYARQEQSSWLIDIAHDICDPSTRRGSLLVWKETTQIWAPVAPADVLTASIYRYDLPVGTIVGLSKISDRRTKSKTTTTGNAGTMHTRVMARDGDTCWVTGFTDPLINSHICPKRMGAHQGKIIYRTFTSVTPDLSLTVYDEVFDLALTTTLDSWFDKYNFGLRHVAANMYECHVFAAGKPGHVRTIYGESLALTSLPLLHGHSASPPNPHLSNNPPPGLFRWHYMQCVIGKFGHSDYRNLTNIDFYVLPLAIQGDSDDEDTDDGNGWPSAPLDWGREADANNKFTADRFESTARWATTNTVLTRT
ncbi:hypothetical protein B0H19DRAFT_1180227 [Mycena capillaripes]|nr:hypothetical protein B0H19DRAFT_1180227 [Mycena capillaripes]